MRTFITCLGGAREIGGSAFVVQFGDQKVLLDAGLYPGRKDDRLYPNIEGLYDLQAALISHGHLDHVGALPKLHYLYPELPIYMTAQTKQLTEILFRRWFANKKERRWLCLKWKRGAFSRVWG